MLLFEKESRAWIALSACTSLLLVCILFFVLKNPVSIDDGLRHYAYGKLMMEQGILNMEWSQFFDHGYLHSHQVDPWFLSNLLFGVLSPLGPVLAPRAFALFSLAMLLGVFLWIFRTLRTPPFIAATLLFVLVFFEPMFYVRLLLGRPYALITVFTVVTLFSAMRKQYIVLFFAITTSVLLSQLFVFPALLSLAVVLWHFSLRDERSGVRVLLVLSFGVLLGVLLHPDRFAYLSYIVDSFLRIPFLPKVELGMEMRSSLQTALRVWLVLGFTSLFSLGFLRSRSDGLRRFHESGLSLFGVLSIVSAVLFLRWSRMVDVAWPMVILFLAILLSKKPTIIRDVLDRMFLPVLRPLQNVFHALLIGSCFLTWLGTTSVLVTSDADRSLQQYEESLAVVPHGAHILNVDWHLFAPMVAVRPDLGYAAGIDPSYTYLTDPDVHTLLAKLSDPSFGEEEKGVGGATALPWLTSLLARYPSDYLVVERVRHPALIQALVAAGYKDSTPTKALAVLSTTLHSR